MRKIVSTLLLALIVFLPGCHKKLDIFPDDGNANSLAKEFLSSENYDKIVIEILYVDGFQPSMASIDNLKNFLEARLNKPSGIILAQNAVPSPGKETLTVKDLELIEKASRTQFIFGKTITAYIYFADADFAENTADSKVLGVAYGNSSMAIFEKTIRESTGGIGQPSTTNVESIVLDHEFGHVLGLVNFGSKPQSNHQDKEHGRHCTNTNCLMYYATETSNFVANILGGSIPSLDEACINDLKANGGK
jgi:hypothetical protein